MKLKLSLILLLLATTSAWAQNPTSVSGTITDPSAVAYYSAQVTACLSPVTTDPLVGGKHVNPNIGVNYCIGPVATAINGSFSMSLHANANITPAGTTWVFTVTAIGSAPPAGTGAQTFQSAGITVSGTSQDVGATLSALAPKLTAGAGGVAAVSSLPATCTPGTTQPVQLNVAPYRIYVCSASNVFIPLQSTTAIVATDYGVKADARYCYGTAVTITNASTTVSCTAANFTTAADVTNNTKVIFGTNNCCNNAPTSTNTNILPQGNIQSVTNSTTVVSSGAAATATCSASPSCILWWGSDDSTAWDAVETAWKALSAAKGGCPAIIMPATPSILQHFIFVTPAVGCQEFISAGGIVMPSITVKGWGPDQSLWVLTPNFNYAGCTGTQGGTGGAGTNGGFFSFTGVNLQDMGITGGWTTVPAGGHNCTIVNLGPGSTVSNVRLTGFSLADGSTVGFNAGAFSTINSLYVQGFGFVACRLDIAGQTFTWTGGACGNSVGASWVANVSANDTITTSGMYFGQSVNGTTCCQMVGTGTWNSTSDFVYEAPTSHNLYIGAAGTINLVGFQETCVGTSGLFIAGSGIVNAVNSQFCGGTDAINRSAGTFHDLGGNRFTSGATTTFTPTCAFTSGGGTSPSCALQAGSTNEKGVIIATTGTGSPGSQGTITLTFAGTYSGATGATPACTYTLDNSGTAWGAESIVFVSTQSTTVPVLAWTNINAVALAALATSSPYRIDYTCVTR